MSVGDVYKNVGETKKLLNIWKMIHEKNLKSKIS
jgi:hypothetical protein